MRDAGILFIAIVAVLLLADRACADVLTDPAAVCAAARTGDGAWLDTAGLRRCLSAEKLRDVDAREIRQLRLLLDREAQARRDADTEVARRLHWRWVYAGGGITAGVLLTVLIGVVL